MKMPYFISVVLTLAIQKVIQASCNSKHPPPSPSPLLQQCLSQQIYKFFAHKACNLELVLSDALFNFFNLIFTSSSSPCVQTPNSLWSTPPTTGQSSQCMCHRLLLYGVMGINQKHLHVFLVLAHFQKCLLSCGVRMYVRLHKSLTCKSVILQIPNPLVNGH